MITTLIVLLLCLCILILIWVGIKKAVNKIQKEISRSIPFFKELTGTSDEDKKLLAKKYYHAGYDDAAVGNPPNQMAKEEALAIATGRDSPKLYHYRRGYDDAQKGLARTMQSLTDEEKKKLSQK